MKIAIDVSKLHSMNKQRGVGFYTQRLVEALRKYTDNEIHLVEEEMDMSQFAVIHYPYFDLFQKTLNPIKGAKTVVTVHDVTPLVFPKAYPPGVRGQIKNFFQRQQLKKVDAIITDSEASKKDIIKYLKIDSAKIHPVYLAPGEQFKRISNLGQVKEKFNLPEKFLLFVGSPNWNKNLVNLTQAAVDAGVDIVFAGKAFEKRENLEHIELRPFAQFLEKFEDNPLVHILGFVSDEDIVPLYNSASALMLPSFYEGFGLTILEAQACGVPVITSDVSSMPEVAGDSALMVDPEKVLEIKAAIEKVLGDEKLRKELVKKGEENVKRFSWKKTAEETDKVYQQIL